jgi:hypothetical protein
MPNGKSIVLERQPGADTSGYSGLEDEVDNHWAALFCDERASVHSGFEWQSPAGGTPTTKATLKPLGSRMSPPRHAGEPCASAPRQPAG